MPQESPLPAMSPKKLCVLEEYCGILNNFNVRLNINHFIK